MVVAHNAVSFVLSIRPLCARDERPVFIGRPAEKLNRSSQFARRFRVTFPGAANPIQPEPMKPGGTREPR